MSGTIWAAEDEHLLAPESGPASPPSERRPPAAGTRGSLRARLVRAALLAALLLTAALAALDQSLVAAALPGVARDLRGGPGVSWAVTAHLLACAAVLPVAGKLGDVLGRKRVLVAALALFIAASALAGWSRTAQELTGFRALQGIGAGGLLATVPAVLADLVPPRRRGRWYALLGTVTGAALVAGPALGERLVEAEHASWRWCFALGAPVGLCALAVVALALRLPRPERRPRPDLLGALLLAAASGCLILLAVWGGTEYAWTSRVTLGLGAGALGTLLLFAVTEHYAAEPLLPPRLLRDPAFAAAGLLSALLGAALAAAGALPSYLQSTRLQGGHALGAAELLLPLLGGIALAALAAGPIADRTGRHRPLAALGAALLATGAYLLSGHLDATASRTALGLWTAVLGLGIGLLLPVLTLAAQSAARAADLGAATAAVHHLRLLGGCLGAALAASVFTSRLTSRLTGPSHGMGLPPVDSLTPRLLHALPAELRDNCLRAYTEAVPRTFLHLVPVLALGCLLAFLLKERPPASEAPTITTTPGAIPPPRPAPAPPAPAPLLTGVAVTGIVRRADGAAVPRAALTLIDATGRQIGRGISEPDGRYALAAPGPGSYVLVAVAGRHQPRAVTVAVADRPVTLDLVLGGAGRLAGTVLTADGSPAPEALVTLTDAYGEAVATTRSGRDGGYALAELPAGEYTLAAGAPGFRPAALPVTVQPSRETRQDIELAGGAVLRGTVRAGGGRLVEEARVTLLDSAGNVVGAAMTGGDGIFRFIGLPAGEYTVIAAGYPPVATVLQVMGGGRTERDLQLGYGD
ncbi:MFS transporter [Streptomyces sp. NPDC057654]|uniref:MFS transporter n=1 Tax=Streptomyces sp. NPDC057654 TaxID=3346196 RepID=UPI00369EADB3